MKNVNTTDDFGQTLSMLRSEKKISTYELTNKVCSESLLRKIEANERQATLMVKARIMKRLGEASDKFDRFLNVNEYGRWILRQKIISALSEKDISKVDARVSEYYKTYKKPSDIVESQFFALVKAERAAIASTDASKLQQMFEAVRDMTLTVDEDGVPNTSFISPVELHLVMDCATFYDSSRKVKIWEYIYKISKDESRDNLEFSLFAPRALYLRCSTALSSEDVSADYAKELVAILNEFTEKLISAGRLYYLKELLYLLKEFCKIIDEPEYNKMAQNASDFIQLLCWIEKITQTPLTPVSTSFFFSDRTVFSLGQVLQRRRRTIGLSVGEACSNICDPKTLRRVETLKTNIQHEIAAELLDRLHLCKNLQHHSLSSSGKSQSKIEKLIIQSYRKKDYASAMNHLNELKAFYDLNMTENKQFFRRHTAIINYAWEKITLEEYAEELLQSLNYSLPAKIVPNRDIFLTREEKSTIFNYIMVKDSPHIESVFIIEKNSLEQDRKEIGLAFDARAYDATLLALIVSSERQKDYKNMYKLTLSLLKNSMENQRCQQIINSLRYLCICLENLPEDSSPLSLAESSDMLQIATANIH